MDVTVSTTIDLIVSVTVKDDVERAQALSDAVHALIANFANPDDLMELVPGWGDDESLVIRVG